MYREEGNLILRVLQVVKSENTLETRFSRGCRRNGLCHCVQNLIQSHNIIVTQHNHLHDICEETNAVSLNQAFCSSLIITLAHGATELLRDV